MKKIDKKIVSKSLDYHCQRFFRWKMATDMERQRYQIVEKKLDAGIKFIEALGHRWETKVYEDLIACALPDHVFHAKQKKSFAEFPRLVSTLSSMTNVTESTFIIEASFDTPCDMTDKLFNACKNHGLSFGKARPDILWIHPSNKPPYAISVIDVKMTPVPSRQHFFELAYYIIALSSFLEKNHLSDRFFVSADAYIWPDNACADVFLKTFDAMKQQSKAPLEDALMAILVKMPKDVHVNAVRSFLDHEVNAILNKNVLDASSNIDHHCNLCDYADSCKERIKSDKNVKMLPFVAGTIANTLENHGVKTIEDIKRGNASYDDAVLENAMIRAESESLEAKAKSLLEKTPMVIPNRSSHAMPISASHSIFINAHFDPATGVSFALGAKSIFSTKEKKIIESPMVEIVESFNFNDKTYFERKALERFSKAVMSWIRAHEKDSCQIYIWQELEVRHLSRAFARYIESGGQDADVMAMANLFPKDECLAHASIVESRPVTVVKKFITHTIALPLPYDYRLFEVANRLQGGNGHFFPISGFLDASDMIPFSRAHEVWNNRVFLKRGGEVCSVEQIMHFMRRSVKKHLNALSFVVSAVKHMDGLKKNAFLKKSAPLPIKTTLMEKAALMEQLENFEKINTILKKEADLQIKSLSPKEREARGHAMRVFEKSCDIGERKRLAFELGKDVNDIIVLSFDPMTVIPDKIKEDGFAISLYNADMSITQDPWENRASAIIENFAEKKKAFIKQTGCGKIDAYYNNPLHECFQVDVLKIDETQPSPFMVVSPKNKVFFSFAKQCGLIHMQGEFILEPYVADYDKHAIADIKRAINNGAQPARSLLEWQTPLVASKRAKDEDILNTIKAMERSSGITLNDRQMAFILRSFKERATLLWGPPGTGKTATLTMTMATWHELSFDRPITMAIGSSNYQAMANVMASLQKILPKTEAIQWFYVRSASTPSWSGSPLVKDVIASEDAMDNPNLPLFMDAMNNPKGTQIVLGTWKQLGKIAKMANGGKSGTPCAPWFDLLVIDEASQVPVTAALGYFLLLKPNGHVLIAGDDCQLGAVKSVSWEDSRQGLFDCVYTFFKDHHGIPPVQLNVNYRSNETLAKWPASRFYNNDYNPIEENRKSVISLDMNAIQNDAALQNYPWLSKVLSPNYPVVVITYPAMHFTHHNPFESELVAMLCALYAKCLPSIDGFFDKRLGVVTPHRAQIKAIAKAIQHHAPDLATQDMAIDTVDRFQGQERDIIIASYAAADPWFIANEESFILDHRRFNVTLTRARKKFILIVSEPVLHHVPSQYETASYASHLQHFPRFDAHEVIQNATFHYAANGASRKSSTTCAIYAYPANKSSKTQEELVLRHRIKSRRLVSA